MMVDLNDDTSIENPMVLKRVGIEPRAVLKRNGDTSYVVVLEFECKRFENVLVR